jgi:hypothetical protein
MVPAIEACYGTRSGTRKGESQMHIEQPRAIQLPRREKMSKLTGRQIGQRMENEICIPVEEGYGREAWFWFPGCSDSEAAHWWVTAGGPRLIGEVFGAADRAAWAMYEEMLLAPELPCVTTDGGSNAALVLPWWHRATLLPCFSRPWADPGRCDRVRTIPDSRHLVHWYPLAHDELIAKWLIADVVAEQSSPADFLGRLLAAYEAAERSSWFGYWLCAAWPANR